MAGYGGARRPTGIDHALVWRPETGAVASLPSLKLILRSAVDHLVCDPQLPRHIPIVRLVDPHMTDAMSEYVVLQVLRLHRRDLDYRAQQEAGIWRELDQQNAAEQRVGILGLGELGQDAAKKLKALGFDVAGWSRSQKSLPGVTSFAGAAGFAPLLSRSEILICLLPLTTETEGILNASTLALLPRGAALVNAARGAHLVEEDLLAALASGQVSAAVLDVFRQEPLPADHPFWRHPRWIVRRTSPLSPTPQPPPESSSTISAASGRPPALNRVDPARFGIDASPYQAGADNRAADTVAAMMPHRPQSGGADGRTGHRRTGAAPYARVTTVVPPYRYPPP
jgi:glyoxylate/hydroxypyruvate reductase A